MATQLSLPQNGLRVGEQIVTDGDSVTLGNNVGVKNNLNVGGSVFANRVITPFVSKEQSTVTPIVIDCSYTDHRILLKSNALGLNFINVPAAADGTFRVKVYLTQDPNGYRTVNWSLNQGSTPAYPSIVWTNTGSDTTVPVYPQLQTVNGRVDVFEFITFDGGLNWVGTQINPNLSQIYTSGVVQIKQVSSTAFTDFSSGVFTDLITMSFAPKYQNSKLSLTAELHHGVSTPNDFSTHFMFTSGTTPISGANVLSTAATGTNTFTDVSQNVHFGGYFNNVNPNNINMFHPSGTIHYSHGQTAGTILDLRIRGRHAGAWQTRNLVLNKSWLFPDTAYSTANTSTFTVMEYLP